MPLAPRIHRSSADLSFETLTDLPRQTFKTDWTGRRLDFRAEFALAETPTHFHYLAAAEMEPKCSSHACGAFVEGLWEQDVAELFIREPDSTHYQEWNVSPTGAWWSQRLTNARITEPKFAPDAATETQVLEMPAGWGIWLKIPHTQPLSRGARINVTMIVTGKDGDRRFLSCCPNPDIEPDFHTIWSYPSPKILNLC